MSKTPRESEPTLLRGEGSVPPGFSFKFDEHQLDILISADLQESLVALREYAPGHFGTDEALHDFFETLVCNSELDWVNPEDTGDLTSAPLLGILGPEQAERNGPFGSVHVGHWAPEGEDFDKAVDWYQPILARWGFMDYALRSPLTDLADQGHVTFHSGN